MIKSKYKNQFTVVDGIRFHSKKESVRYGQLKMLERAKKIFCLKLQQEFKLMVNGILVCKYRGDFSYLTTDPDDIDTEGEWIVEDVKSPATRKIPSYVIKKKLMLAIFGIEIKEI